jgi:hypothetical protein
MARVELAARPTKPRAKSQRQKSKAQRSTWKLQLDLQPLLFRFWLLALGFVGLAANSTLAIH